MTVEPRPVSAEDLARLAAHALTLLPEAASGEFRIGLGSGRAAVAFVCALGARVREGLRARGVPTSEATAALAGEVGIPLVELDRTPLDLTVDGADEVDPALNLIKGYGGALVRERIVAAASRRQVILVTADKMVARLGTRGRLPVEIIPFGRPLCEQRLAALGCRPGLRAAGGRPFITDNGNLILDCTIGMLEDPPALEREIRRIPGVVDTGFFLGTADTVLVAEAGTVRTLRRQGPRA
ncbi:MAG: ribose-5-phosphate isomerase RpiA [Candidatus Rokubacteria bacterium]|nr:ribose-5-phosphate isomerase RpiA [Candidatus Rokubacteria bacterium]